MNILYEVDEIVDVGEVIEEPIVVVRRSLIILIPS